MPWYTFPYMRHAIADSASAIWSKHVECCFQHYKWSQITPNLRVSSICHITVCSTEIWAFRDSWIFWCNTKHICTEIACKHFICHKMCFLLSSAYLHAYWQLTTLSQHSFCWFQGRTATCCLVSAIAFCNVETRSRNNSSTKWQRWSCSFALHFRSKDVRVHSTF